MLRLQHKGAEKVKKARKKERERKEKEKERAKVVRTRVTSIGEKVKMLHNP